MSAAPLLADDFSGPDGLITNEYAYWNADDPAQVSSPTWVATSGSLFRLGGQAWTGHPDDANVNRTSSSGNDSAIFRLRTRQTTYGDVTVSMRLDNLGFVTTPSTPAVDWDGVHIWLRYADPEDLYAVSVNRRDGTICIKKKATLPGDSTGTYWTLAGGHYSFPLSSWQSVSATARTLANGSVALSLTVAGQEVLSVTDTGTGTAPLTHPGAVGVRGDNDEFLFDDLTVRAA